MDSITHTPKSGSDSKRSTVYCVRDACTCGFEAYSARIVETGQTLMPGNYPQLCARCKTTNIESDGRRCYSFSEQELFFLRDALLDDVDNDVAEAFELILHLREVRRNLPKDKKFKTHSSTAEDISTEDTSAETEQNVSFADEPSSIALTVGMMSADRTFNQGQQEDAQLAQFLSRPLRILERDWTVGAVTPFLDVFNPWALFLSNSRVSNKLQTFKLLKGTLKLKFLINGSAFHYGRVLIGIRPTRYDNNTVDLDMLSTQAQLSYKDAAGTGQRSIRSMNTLYSSRPHAFLDPCANSPVHIDWPYFVATNWLDITDDTSFDRMGRVEMWELTQLRHSNGATDPITISVFAWMEDVELTGLTISPPLITQSSKDDEYNDGGAISTPATNVAAAAAYFTDIPIIGRYAKATQMAFGTISSVAKLFGFSRPAIIADTTLVKPLALGNLANTVGGDPLVKLTLDPKQELTVDPATVGLPGEDQMSFGFIIKREAWIDSFPWVQSSDSETLLYTIAVHPLVAPVDFVDPQNRYHQTPLSFVTTPFTYWSGSIRYRIQVVASSNHRGRLLIQYDPTVNNSTSPVYNSRYSQIVDITEERDFTLEVKWSQPQAYLEVDRDNLVQMTSLSQDGLTTLSVPDCYNTNGILQVYVLNQLASPVDTANVEVNVFISGGDDFVVRAPNGNLTNFCYARDDIDVGPPITTQSDNKDITANENEPGQTTTYFLNGSYCGCDPAKDNVYFGETVVSVRSLLKRYNFYRTLRTPTLSANVTNLVTFTQFNFPNGPGPSYGSSVASPLTPISGATAYNLTSFTYIRYFAQAYIGWRGGLRYKVLLNASNASLSSLLASRSSTRITTEATGVAQVTGTGITPSVTARRFLANTPWSETLAGSLVNSGEVNPSLEYEVPLYTPYRYVEVSEPVITPVIISTYQSHYDGGGHSVSYVNFGATVNEDEVLTTFVSTGEDFSFFFFIGAPPIYDSDVLTVSL